MYLFKIIIKGFRRLEHLEVRFKEGLNVLVGPNNAGKTAIIDALRVLLSTGEDGALRLTVDDLHVDKTGARATEASFEYVFRGLSVDDEADFLTALRPFKGAAGPEYEAHLSVRCSSADMGGRLRIKRWCGAHEENSVTTEMLEDLRAVYLQPLRDPAQGLRPSRTSQLARLVRRLSDPVTQKEVVDALDTLDKDLQKTKPIADTASAITKRHGEMLGEVLRQKLALNLSPGDFQRVAARLSLAVESFDVEQNGLGFNNLIYMAVVLSELSLSKEAAYCALIVEEPEAHLHPQLQAVLLDYLSSVQTPAAGEKPVQVFVTSHSPNFASLADIDAIGCVYHTANGPAAFFPREVAFDKTKKEKLQRYLNVTRAEIFFARRIVFVEGAAELFLFEAFATKHKVNLKKHAVSVISTEGLNFDAFLPLFGKGKLEIPVVVLTDSDPTNCYPQPEDVVKKSGAAEGIAALEDEFVKPFFAQKTLEYDIAFDATSRSTMLKALAELHPVISKELEAEVLAADEKERAKALFKGMFERGEGKTKVQKGAFAQSLAHAVISDGCDIVVPGYIVKALEFVMAE
ncbi:putative ATP-dependent endonuclease of OLD family [Paraburkholderia sp. JPY158]|uniref:Putative ATP-dependent endonuclease of OLD family n=1 Tax=Paraburkholderia atlantica TaxID=2654982 RepID=A0A7W8QD82_PARAM|nr:AAA family ATPase [Paraburkholderia atlantica]MBB5428287.1 putative ATP-dependent endonuclease of OLD family [Paraburkholderia atlantica]